MTQMRSEDDVVVCYRFVVITVTVMGEKIRSLKFC
jgi:hypothetical protein